jgi:hypothetical protein
MWRNFSDAKRRRKGWFGEEVQRTWWLVQQKEGRADYFRVASVDQSAGSGSEPELARGRESTFVQRNLTISPRGPIKSDGLIITANRAIRQ